MQSEISPTQTIMNAEGLLLASGTRRFLNFVIDAILIRVLALGIIELFFSYSFKRYLSENEGLAYLLGLGLYFLYYLLFELAFQRTPGKFITSTRVVMEDGSRPETLALFKRTLSRLVPFEPFSSQNQTWWHDRWTKTRVVG